MRRNFRQYRWKKRDLYIGAVILLMLVLFFRALAESGYRWRWEKLLPMLAYRDDDGAVRAGLFLHGLAVTLKLSFWSFLLACLIGIPLGIARTLPLYPLRCGVTAYVETFRNLPPLVVVFLVNYVLFSALLGGGTAHYPAWAEFLFIDSRLMGAFWSGIFAMGLYQGAYVVEITRAGIDALPVGQMEAAKALAVSPLHTYSRIILPQALRNTLPSLVNQLISTLKATSIVSVLAVPELAKRGSDIQKTTSQSFEAWIVTGIIYFIAAVAIGSLLERALKLRS